MDLITDITSRKSRWDCGLILFFDNNDPIRSIQFFEADVLHNILVDKNLTLVTDYQGFRKIANDPSGSRYTGIYYNIEQVKMKTNGVFHPKLYLFVSDKKIRLLIGSFNLTKSGFKRNLESVVKFEFELETMVPEESAFLLEVKEFLQKTFLSSNDLIEPVSDSLKTTVDGLVNSTFFKKVEKTSGFGEMLKRKCFFLSSIEQSLISQVSNKIGDHFDKIQVLSPFYDANLYFFQRMKPFADIIEIYVPAKGSTFPKEQFLDNMDLAHEFTFFKVTKEDSKVERFIHAKYYSFLKNKQKWDFITSANFTSAGLLNGTSKGSQLPCNLEIGVLVQNNKKDLFSELIVKDLNDFNDLNSEINSSIHNIDLPLSSDETNEKLLIESAYYDSEKVYFRFFDSEKKVTSGNFIAKLFLDQAYAGDFPLDKNKEDFSFSPALEIEGDKRIQFLLASKSEGFESIIANVNRLKHEPNYLPALGASAFNECLKIGGEAGLERAFKIAKDSGKEDWLLHLLTHWPLDKILDGIKNDDLGEEGLDDEEVLLPSLKEKKITDYRHFVLRKNISSLLGTRSAYENLIKFVDKFDKFSDKKSLIIEKYNKYCFPLFFEISFRFCSILKREELKKQQRPTIIYPEYTWLRNFNEYHRYFNLIINKLLPLSFYSKGKLDDLEYILFFIRFSALIELHSPQTINHLLEKQKHFAEKLNVLNEYIDDAWEKHIWIPDSPEFKVVQEIVERYGVLLKHHESIKLKSN